MKKTKRRKQPKPRQPGFFDVQQRAEQLSRMGDPLVGLNAQVDWEAFRSWLVRIHDKPPKSAAGAKPYDVVLMFKMLVLQQLHNLGDEKVEYSRDVQAFDLDGVADVEVMDVPVGLGSDLIEDDRRQPHLMIRTNDT